MVFQIILTVIGAFVSVILTKFLIQNGRAIIELGRRMDEGFRRMDERFEKLGEKMDERTTKIAELIVSEGEKTRKLLEELRAG